MKQLPVLVLSALMACAVTASEAPCQEKKAKPPVNKRGTPQIKGDSLRNYRREQGEKHVLEDPGEKYQPGTNVPLHERVALKGLGNFVQAFVGTDPGRLAPGQSGELRLVLALKGKYVMEDGAHVSVRYRRQQGKVSLGQWRILPAGIGKLNTTYRGRAVYDNTATIVLPVSVASGAAYGQSHLGIEVEVDVSNGETGNFHGRYMMDVRSKVEIGRPLPTIKKDDTEPEIDAPLVSANSADPTEAASGSDARNAELNTDPVIGGDLVSAETGDLRVTQGSAQDSTSAGMEASEEGSINWLLYTVPGVLLLLLLAMALRKGKS